MDAVAYTLIALLFTIAAPCAVISLIGIVGAVLDWRANRAKPYRPQATRKP